MNIFLTGATGYVGTVIAEKLLEAGHTVRGLARNDQSEARLRERGITPVRGDLNTPASLLAPAREADAVIHTAFHHDFANFGNSVEMERHALAAFADALAGTTKPFIATSASGLLQDTGDVVADELYPYAVDTFGAVRAGAEQDALATAQRGIRTSVLRLPFYVYGRNGSTFVPSMLEAARKTGVTHWVEPGTNRYSAVHVDDLADLYLLALAKAPAGSLYNAALEHGITARQIAEAVGANVGCQVESLTPEEALALLGPGLTFFRTTNSQISGGKAQRELGWSKRIATNLLEDIAHGSYKS